jgi:hypothetical protein
MEERVMKRGVAFSVLAVVGFIQGPIAVGVTTEGHDVADTIPH